MHIENHRLLNDKNDIFHIKHISSPNYSQFSWADDTNWQLNKQLQLKLIVLHNISIPPKIYDSEYVIDFFCNKLDCSLNPYFKKIINMQVSSHLYIMRNGNIIQFVNFNKKAWHAGRSVFFGRKNCNDFALGIELAGSDDELYCKKQYKSLNQTIATLADAYPSIEAITSHSFISPERKTDPGKSFDWQELKSSLIKYP